MDSIYESTMLFDFYGELLTENQKEVMRLRLQEDYSLSEISEILKISRQGVYDSVHRAEKALVEYENTLHLLERFMKNRDKVAAIRELAMQAKSEEVRNKPELLDAIIAYTLEIE